MGGNRPVTFHRLSVARSPHVRESDAHSGAEGRRTVGAGATVDDFLAHLAMRAMSDKTIRRRRSSLRSLARFAHPQPLLEVGAETIEDWLATFSAPRTRHAYRSDVAAFFDWAAKRRLATSPMAEVGTVRVPKSLPHPVPANLLPTIIATAEGTTLRLALALAAYAGLRCAEITTLLPDHVDHAAGVIFVRDGKGSKDRVVPLHPVLATMLRGHRGAGPYVPVTPDHLGKRASAHMRALGIDATLHNLRATFATELSRQTNGNLLLVGEMLGHASLDTTRGYVRLGGSEQATEAVRRLYESAA